MASQINQLSLSVWLKQLDLFTAIWRSSAYAADCREAGRGTGAEEAARKAQRDGERAVLSAEEQRRRAEEEVEEMLRSLKQDLGSKSGGR